MKNWRFSILNFFNQNNCVKFNLRLKNLKSLKRNKMKNNSIEINLDLCAKLANHTAIVLYAHLLKMQSGGLKNMKIKQDEIAISLNTSVYKIATATKLLEKEKMISIEQRRDSGKATRGVPSYIYTVLA